MGTAQPEAPQPKRRSAAEEARVLNLPDGRRLGYAEYGTPDGAPMFVFHGTPGSRLMLRVTDAPARRLGVRVIAPDRPGFGLSDPQQGRRLLDWPDDVAALADALGLEGFAVAGISGGGPYTLACALKLSERLTVAGVISGMGPPVDEVRAGLGRRHRAGFATMRAVPPLLSAIMAVARLGWDRAPERIMNVIHGLLPDADRAIVARPEVRDSLMAGLREAFRQGGRGAADELLLFVRPWGFPLEDIRAPVRLWHGESDTIVPAIMGRHAASAIPDCRAELIPGAGHYWAFDHIEELLAILAPASGAATYG
jgi:pimeloyl-ACP methyl ester carboxylesterase